MRQTGSDARTESGAAVRVRRARSWSCAVVVLVLVLGLGLDAACGDNAALEVDPEAYRCPPPAPTSCPSPAPRYADVAPIIARNCLSCHYGYTDGPWPLTDYQHVADWADVVRDEVRTCAMPPADAGFRMRTADRVALLTWIRCDLPE